MMKTVLTMVVILGLATMVQADLVVVVDPGVDVGGGLTSFTVRLVADNPDDAAAGWEGSFDGPMNQVKFGGSLDTPTMTFASLLGSDEAKDSHFLLYDADLYVGVPITESPVQLTGAFGLAPAVRLENLPFAQIVLAAGDEVVMTGMAGNAATDMFETNVTIVPEPLTLTLLGLGGLALIRRRRA